MIEQGIVINKDSTGIDVQMSGDYACEGCSACFLDKDNRHILKVHTDIAVDPGERVEVEIHPGFALKSAFLLFFLPAVMMITGYYLFKLYLPLREVAGSYRGIGGALLGIIITYVGVYFYDRHLQKTPPKNRIRILRVLK